MNKALLSILAVAALAFSQMGGCASNGTSPAVHGELDTGTVIDPNNPGDIKVNVGGKIFFAKRDKNAGVYRVTRPASTVNEGP